jgi:hypothetical protein
MNTSMNSDNECIKLPKLEYLEPLKPLNVEKLKMNVSELRPLDRRSESSESSASSALFAPINVFGNSSEPTVPNISKTFGSKNKKPKNPNMLNPLYYKTRSMHTEYNSLMNSLYPGTETFVSDISEPPAGAKPPEPEVSEDPIQNPEKTEQNNVPNVPSVLEVPKTQEPNNPKNLNRTTFQMFQKVHETLCDKTRQKFASELFETSEATLNALECSKVIVPKEYDLNESLIEVLDISKKSCVVWYEGETVSYAKFRENPDHILFFVGEDAYGYSKKLLFEEYQKSKGIYFDLNLNWEDNETLWIPMSQIAKLLEFSHPVYEIQKMKYSMSVWNLTPVKLKK